MEFVEAALFLFGMKKMIGYYLARATLWTYYCLGRKAILVQIMCKKTYVSIKRHWRRRHANLCHTNRPTRGAQQTMAKDLSVSLVLLLPLVYPLIACSSSKHINDATRQK